MNGVEVQRIPPRWWPVYAEMGQVAVEDGGEDSTGTVLAWCQTMRYQLGPSLAGLLSLALLAAPAASERPFQDDTDVVVVEIPVQVTRNGLPVLGLTADDFEVRDGRKRRQIVGFDVIDLGSDIRVSYHTEDIPVSGRRHFLLLFDLTLSRPSSIVRARRAAAALLESSLHETDLVAVGVYSVSGAQILLGFTPDRGQISTAIETLGLPQLVNRAPDPLGIVLAQPSSALGLGVAGGRDSRSGVNADSEVLAILESLQSQFHQAAERNIIQALTAAMSELAMMIGAVQGNKHVVFLSEGFDSRIAFGSGVGSVVERQAQQTQAEQAATGQLWNVDSNTRFGSTNVLGSLELMAKEFVRAGAAIHAVDIGGTEAANDVVAHRPADDGLFLMADRTGGEHYRNYNDLGAAMGKMLERTSVTYVLAVQPQDLELDGHYRQLKVSLKRKVRGAELTHRPGYFAPRPYREQGALERRLVTAELLLSGREGGTIETVVDADVTGGSGASSAVQVAIEIDRRTVSPASTAGAPSVEVYAYALDSQGVVRDFFAGEARLDLSAKAAEAEQAIRIAGELQLPPEEYVIRTLVRNASTGEKGLRATRLTVPAD